ncbi:hypothetical protein N9M26_00505 [Alphaproteobacteria bacterium]|nr:hypothetical protein [Alphaproteobacteria bacterium]
MQIELRKPEFVMKLNRLGSFHQSKLSFLRSFIREFKDWDFETKEISLDRMGFGHCVYVVKNDSKHYSLICFSNHLDDGERSDRVIATKWDASFVLFDGVPSTEDIQRLKDNVPLQEQGRVTEKELCLSRANKSVRVFEHVVDQLSQGKQPDTKILYDVGYLYRTTAVYGSGKFGLADRIKVQDREELRGPFRLEMMLVFLARQFTFDMVNHVAYQRSPESAVMLDDNIARNLGIGNSTGLGMAPFIVNHPALLNQWIHSREKALQAIRKIPEVTKDELEKFHSYLSTIQENIKFWKTDSEYQIQKNTELSEDLIQFKKHLSKTSLEKSFWNSLYLWVEKNTQPECCELIVSLLMEVYPDLIEPLSYEMSINEEDYFDIDTSRTIGDICNLIENRYGWLIDINFKTKDNIYNFWYYSKNKQEPRMSDRFNEDGAELELPLAIARDINLLYKQLKNHDSKEHLSNYLLKSQEYRHVLRRIFICEKLPYSEIQDNTISKSLIPVDMLRLKLSFFGATRFDPRSDRWVRITMYQGAPLMKEISLSDDTWSYKKIA